MRAKIIRLSQTKQGAFGVIIIDGDLFCYTLQPDDTDTHFHIPAGDYICNRYTSPKHGDTFVISRPETPGFVDGHSYLELHAGNVEDDTEGCILLGATVGKLKGNRAVLNSGATFKAFMDYAKDVASFPLRIVDCY